MLTSAALSGLLALGGAAPAFAQAPGSKGAPPAAAPAKPSPAKPSPAKPPLTEQQKKDNALALFKQAETLFLQGDCAAAMPLYRQADTLHPGHVPKYKIAACLDNGGQVIEAVAAYQVFLDAKPDPQTHADKIAGAQKRIEELKKTPAKVKVVTVPAAVQGLALAVDAAAQQGPEMSIAPGKHRLTVQAAGYEPVGQDFEVGFAETRELRVQLVAVAAAAPPPAAAPAPPPAAPAPAPEAPPAAPPSSPLPAYIAFGAAGAGLVVGTVFGIMALGAKSDYEQDPTTDNLDKIDTQSTVADIGFASAVGFGLAGTVLFLNSRPQEPPPAAARAGRTGLRLAPYAGPTGAGAQARFTF